MHASNMLGVESGRLMLTQVPFLPGSNGVRSELESQSQDMKDPPAKPEPAAGFLNLPVAGSLGGPSSADGKQALAEAAEDVQEQEADRQGFNLGFLKHAPFGLGGGGSLNGKQAQRKLQRSRTVVQILRMVSA